MLTIPQGQETRQSSCRALPSLATADMLPNPRAATQCTLVRALGWPHRRHLPNRDYLKQQVVIWEVSKRQISEHSSLQSEVLHPEVSVEQEGRSVPFASSPNPGPGVSAPSLC